MVDDQPQPPRDGEPDFKALTPIVDALRASADELERQGIVCSSLDRAIESLSYFVRAKEIVWDIPRHASRQQPKETTR